MTGRIRIAVITAALCALVIEGITAVGVGAWDTTARVLRRNPDDGAARLIESTLLDLPPAVFRSRRLVSGYLSAADAAVEALEAVGARQIRSMPAAPDGFLNIARARLLGNRIFEGLDDLDDAIARDPTGPFGLRLSALVMLLQGRTDDALDRLARAEAVAPGYRLPPIELSAEDQARVRLEGLELRLEIYPRIRVETLIALAGHLRSMGRRDEGLRRLEEAAGAPRADLVRAQWALIDGNAPEAAGLAQGLANRKRLPSKIRSSAWSTLAQALEAQGDTRGALDAARKALRLAPDSAAPHLALARIARARGDLDETVEHLRRAWGMDPSNLGILFEFARAAEAAGLEADARLALERAVNLRPDDSSVALRLVDFQLRHGAYMEAVMTLSRALDRDPVNPDLLRMGERLRREVAKRETR